MLLCVVLGMVFELRCFSLDVNHNNDIADRLIRRTSIWNTHQALVQMSIMGKELEQCREVLSKICVDACDFSVTNIIVVIGESYNRHHSSLYGYGLDTNPLLSKREGLLAFSDVISPINGTIVSFNDFMSTGRLILRILELLCFTIS